MPLSRVTIVGLGDSTTAGTPGFRSPLEAPPNGEGNPESQYAFWMMRSHPDWIVLNRGVNGETAEEVRARLLRDALGARPAYVIVLAGVNVIFAGQRPETVERHLAAMYPGIQDVGVHGGQMTFDRLGPLAGKDVVHSREDDHIGGTRPERIPKQPGSNLLRGLAIHPAIQHDPIGVGPHHPKRVLALRIPFPVGRSLERRAESGSSRGRRVAEADDRDSGKRHREGIGSRLNMLTNTGLGSIGDRVDGVPARAI